MPQAWVREKNRLLFSFVRECVNNSKTVRDTSIVSLLLMTNRKLHNMRFRLALRMRSLRSLTLDDLEPLVRIFGEFRVILQIGGGAKRLLLSNVQITLILLGVHQLQWAKMAIFNLYT